MTERLSYEFDEAGDDLTADYFDDTVFDDEHTSLLDDETEGRGNVCIVDLMGITLSPEQVSMAALRDRKRQQAWQSIQEMV